MGFRKFFLSRITIININSQQEISIIKTSSLAYNNSTTTAENYELQHLCKKYNKLFTISNITQQHYHYKHNFKHHQQTFASSTIRSSVAAIAHRSFKTYKKCFFNRDQNIVFNNSSVIKTKIKEILR